MTQDERKQMIERFRTGTDNVADLVRNLDEADLTTAYLTGEWTVAQNIHHLADSHMAAFFRFKMILTQDRPNIPTYVVDDFAATPEAITSKIIDSLAILRGINRRWADLAETLNDEQWNRVGIRPDGSEQDLNWYLQIYSNHCYSHIDQITKTLAAKGE